MLQGRDSPSHHGRRASTCPERVRPTNPPLTAQDWRTRMAAPPSIDRHTFLAHLRRSGLVSNEQLDQIARRFPDRKTGRDLALALIDDGTLTRFQTARLLLGQPEGFTLGQYRLLDQVGRGGMGRVFKAL